MNWTLVTYPQQPYPPQQGGYAPQQPYPPQQPAPQYQQPAYQPQQGYPPPQQTTGYMPPQQYGPPPGYPPQQPVPEEPAPRGTIKGFWEQPAGSAGPPLKFPDRAYGTRYAGTVIRDVTDADMEVQRDPYTKIIRRHPDGREKQQMKIPLAIQPTAEFPNGVGVFYVKGADQSELARAMKAAGCVPDENGDMVPRQGDVMDIVYTHDLPGKQGQNPAKIRTITYAQAIAPSQPITATPAPYQPQASIAPQPIASSPAQYQPQASAVPQPTAIAPAPQFQQPQYQATGFPQPTGLPPGYPPQQAYQQATGQPMPPPQQYQQPQYQANPGPQPIEVPPGYPQQPAPQYQQQPFPTAPGPDAMTVHQQYTNGAPPTGAAFHSEAQATHPTQPMAAPPQQNEGPPPGWPADMPWAPWMRGLSPEMAAVAQQLRHPSATGQPQ